MEDDMIIEYSMVREGEYDSGKRKMGNTVNMNGEEADVYVEWRIEKNNMIYNRIWYMMRMSRRERCWKWWKNKMTLGS